MLCSEGRALAWAAPSASPRALATPPALGCWRLVLLFLLFLLFFASSASAFLFALRPFSSEVAPGWPLRPPRRPVCGAPLS